MNSTQSTWRALLIAAAGIVAVTGCGELESKPYERRVPAHARSSKPKKAEPLPIVSQVKPFLLWDENSEELTLDTLKGKVWVADFIFTNCINPCPAMTQRMRGLQGAFEKDEGVRLVSFSVDPGRDSPEVLFSYARQYGAIKGKWHFATGAKKALKELQFESMKINGDGDNMLNHSTRFVLVDQQGRVRGYYKGLDADDVKRLEKDVRRLLGESS
ncbi:MAG: SCO family protein [Planctomycetota bacterium]